MNKSVLLASESKYRKQLLEQLGFSFTVAPSNIDESPQVNESPTTLVIRLAKEKALFQLSNFPKHIIIGSDQVADIDNVSIGKPKTRADAYETLMACKGRRIPFHTGLCLINGEHGKIQTHIDTFYIHYREYSDKEINNFLDKHLLLSCAGSIDWQVAGISLIKKLEGNDPNSLTGLPLIKLCEMFRNINFQII